MCPPHTRPRLCPALRLRAARPEEHARLRRFCWEQGARRYRQMRTWKRARSLLHHVTRDTNLVHVALVQGQVALVQAGMAPSAAELAWAQRVVDASAAAGGAAVAVDGKMVDRPVLLRAEAILGEAG